MAKKKKVIKKNSVKKTVKKAAKKAVKKTTAKKATKKAAPKSTKKTTKKVVTKAAKKAVKKTTAKKASVAKSATTSGNIKAKKNEKKLKKQTSNSEVINEEEFGYEEEFEDEFEEDEIILTDAEGNAICRVPDCDQIAQVETYCRYHYLLFWKKIQVRKKILDEGKLEKYIEDLTTRYPDKFIDILKKDLKSKKDFLSIIHELEIDESNVDDDYEDEAKNYIEEIRGASDSNSKSNDDDDY